MKLVWKEKEEDDVNNGNRSANNNNRKDNINKEEHNNNYKEYWSIRLMHDIESNPGPNTRGRKQWNADRKTADKERKRKRRRRIRERTKQNEVMMKFKKNN